MNQQNIQRALKRMERVQNKLSKEGGRIKEEYIKRLTKEFNKIKNDTVGKKYRGWYGEYEPMYYRRHYELYKVVSLDINDTTGDVKIKYDSSKLTGFYRVTMNRYLGQEKGREYIYQLSFVDGFHGGARSGPPDRLGRPFPGNKNMPFYRTPPSGFFPLKYSLWGQAAIQTSSPKRTIERRFSKSYSEICDTINEELEKRMNEYYEQYKKDCMIIIAEFNKSKKE